ncbi:MAG: response regulator, partial [Candidatus Pacebacteria bacterium]|nr:response regulator [Candidatus Paceibacterota bacterium]
RPDVTIMDVGLPDMDGIAVTQQLKARWPDIKVIGLSVYDDTEILRRMEDAGAGVFLSKSGPCECLLGAVRETSGAKAKGTNG